MLRLGVDVAKSPQEVVETFSESHVMVTVQSLLKRRNLFPSPTMTWRLLLPSFLTMLLRKTWRKKKPRVPEAKSLSMKKSILVVPLQMKRLDVCIVRFLLYSGFALKPEADYPETWAVCPSFDT